MPPVKNPVSLVQIYTEPIKNHALRTFVGSELTMSILRANRLKSTSQSNAALVYCLLQKSKIQFVINKNNPSVVITNKKYRSL